MHSFFVITLLIDWYIFLKQIFNFGSSRVYPAVTISGSWVLSLIQLLQQLLQQWSWMAVGASASGAAGNAVRIVVAGDAKTGKSSLIVTAAAENFPSNVPPVLPPTRLPDDLYPDRVPVTIIDTSSRSVQLIMSIIHGLRLKVETLTNRKERRKPVSLIGVWEFDILVVVYLLCLDCTWRLSILSHVCSLDPQALQLRTFSTFTDVFDVKNLSACILVMDFLFHMYIFSSWLPDLSTSTNEMWQKLDYMLANVWPIMYFGLFLWLVDKYCIFILLCCNFNNFFFFFIFLISIWDAVRRIEGGLLKIWRKLMLLFLLMHVIDLKLLID